MSIVVTHGSRKTANVVVKSINNVLIPRSTTPISLTGQIGQRAETRLDQLNDVIEGNTPLDGQTLVYDEDTDTYVLSFAPIDGGTF